MCSLFTKWYVLDCDSGCLSHIYLTFSQFDVIENAVVSMLAALLLIHHDF